MPPAPTTRTSRPSSIYSSGPASSSKKRSSVSPADPSQMQPQAPKPVVKKHASPGKARVLTAAIHGQQKLNVVPAPSKARSVRNQNRLLYEDEYQDEVTAYMHTMEVSTLPSRLLLCLTWVSLDYDTGIRRPHGHAAGTSVVHATFSCRLFDRDPPPIPPAT